MTQVTRLGGVIPILTSGAVGYDPGEVADSEDVPDPVDVANGDDNGSVAEVPFIVSGSAALVQSVTAESASSTTALTATYGATPTQGNLLTLVAERRDAAIGDFIVPSGWSTLAEVTTRVSPNEHPMIMCYKIAGASESTTVTMDVGHANAKRMVIAEWSGVGTLDTSTTLSGQSGATTQSIGPITPTAGVPALILAGFIKNVDDSSPNAFTPGSGYTELDDAKVYGGVGPRYEVEYQLVGTTSGSYTPDSTQADSVRWAAIAAIFVPLTNDTVWNIAPETIDGDDATYDAVATASDGSIWRIQLSGSKKIAHVIAKIGASAGASQTTDLYGANEPDFSDEALLATRNWTSTGSYTSDTIEMLPPGTTAYQYYRLTGPDDIRIYTVEMYPPATITMADLAGYQQTDEKDQPNGYPSLDAGGLVPVAELPNIEDLNTGSTDTTKVYAPDGAGGVTLVTASLTVKDEGTPLATGATSLDFVGAGVAASGATAAKTITISGAPAGTAGGDLSGTYPNPTVAKINGSPLGTISAPATGDRLRWNGSAWVNSALIWRPVMVLDPTSGNYLPVTASGDAVLVET